MAARGVILAAALACCCAATAAAPRIVMGYYAGEDPVVFRSVTSFAGHLTAISAARYNIDAAGRITGTLASKELLPFNRAHGFSSFACVGNFGSEGDFDGELGHRALVDSRAAMLDSLVQLTVGGGYDGLNLDFESLRPSDRAAYSRFVADLAARLHGLKLKLVLSVPAETKDDPEDKWAGAFDYKVIGQQADLLQLMTYDEHGPGWSDPGPVAGADWVEQCVAYSVSVVPAAKLLMGLPAYGYDWDLTAKTRTGTYPASYVAWTRFGEWLAMPGAVQRWDPVARTPSVRFSSAGHDHEAWFDNAASITAKAALAKKYNLGGVAVWSLGQEDLAYWEAVRAGLR